MTLLGSLLGYDQNGDDILGVNHDPKQNCVVCGRNALTHSDGETAECMIKLFRRTRVAGRREDGSERI